MTNVITQMVIYCTILAALAIPLGSYIKKVMNGERVFLSRALQPVESLIYRGLKIDRDEDMDWKMYSACAAVFSVMSLAVLWAILSLQKFLPLNPLGVDGMSWHLGFNTAASFTTNTNWQAYSGESTLSYFSQMIGLNFQNFVSAAVGIVVLYALIRGFVRVKGTGLGNFYTDMTRTVLYILLPLSVVVSLAIASQGVPQTFKPYDEVQLLEPITIENEDGTTTHVTKGAVPLGPAVSQIAIKQLGTNGGGFWGNNSAHPFENPTPLSNLLEMMSLLLIPAALCFTFGQGVKDRRQGKAIFLAMFLMLAAAMAVVGYSEQAGTPQLSQNEAVYLGGEGQAGGNMEGKETRFGIAASSTWAVFTTAASNGSVNSMHDSYTPIGGLVPMLLMQLGEVVFGGTGCGLYGMIGFAMLFARYLPMFATLAIAGSLVSKKKVAVSSGTLPTHNAMFIFLLIFVVLLVGALSFFPALSLGPAAEFFQMTA